MAGHENNIMGDIGPGPIAMIALIVLALVFSGIAFRRIGGIRLQIWQIMGLGALSVILTLQITPIDAIYAINVDVMLFLFGMFVVSEALVSSGYLSYLSHKLFKRARSVDGLVLVILFGIGTASAFLMNDTLAIMGTPLVILLAKRNDISPKLLLITLAFSVTIGSVMSPIGNPQNLLIAVKGSMESPFVDFFRYLFIPTMINLVLAFLLLRLFFRKEFRKKVSEGRFEGLKDRRLALLSQISLSIIVVLVAVKIALSFLDVDLDLRLTYIALAAAAPILLFSGKRVKVLKNLDWRTLLFFVFMFILMQSVWDTGFFQGLIEDGSIDVLSNGWVMGLSVIISQFISNVPMVALYMPIMTDAGAGTEALTVLAAGSTIAGNLTILGAASNIIIIQNAEKGFKETLTFLEFAKIGIPLTVLNVAVHLLYFAII